MSKAATLDKLINSNLSLLTLKIQWLEIERAHIELCVSFIIDFVEPCPKLSTADWQELADIWNSQYST